jgi:hypothetical protein
MPNSVKIELKPRDAVMRILESAGAGPVRNEEAFWLGHNMEQFVKFAREHCELLATTPGREAPGKAGE